MMPAKYRGVVAGVVGCLLVAGLLGTIPYQEAIPVEDTLSDSSAVTVESQKLAEEPVARFRDEAQTRGEGYEYLTLTESARSRRARRSTGMGVVTHIIEDGESTWTIAQRYSTDVGTLQALNPGTNPENLVPGDPIRVVPYFSGLVHTVERGDTLESIAITYGVSVDQVLEAAMIEQADTLAIGTQLLVPGARLRAQVASRSDSERRTAPTVTAAASVAPAKPAPPAPPPTPAPAPSPVKKGGWIWPLTGGLFFSEYGYRDGGFHRGLDVAAPVGTPVVAATGGVVLASGWDGGYGYCVTIDHGDGIVSKYAHASQLLVDAGQKVAQGQQVILVGNTGNSTGPHLHFEVLVNGATVNPRQYLP